MEHRSPLDRLIASLTAERVRVIIQEIVRKQPKAAEYGVSLPDVLDAATTGVDLGEGPEGWRARMRAKATIVAALAGIPGMTYVEGDA